MGNKTLHDHLKLFFDGVKTAKILWTVIAFLVGWNVYTGSSHNHPLKDHTHEFKYKLIKHTHPLKNHQHSLPPHTHKKNIKEHEEEHHK